MKIYLYKVKHDTGAAPCIYKGLLSLGICKPCIRSSCEPPNSWIVGVGAKTTIGERLIYVSRVTEKLTGGEYYKKQKYSDRPDCIYQWDKEKEDFFVKKNAKYHKDGSGIGGDLGEKEKGYLKANVLLSNEFVYYGEKGTEEYKRKYPLIKELVEELTQGHRVNYPEILNNELKSLIKDAMREQDKYVNSSPSEKNSKKIYCEGEIIYKCECS